MNPLFEAKTWGEAKQTLLEGLDAKRTKLVSILLENQRQYLMETPGADVTSTGNIASVQKMIMPMIRRIIPGTIATELVGVQPMTMPTGLVASMRFVYKNSATVGAGEAPGGNIAVDDETFGNTSATAPYASKMRRFYAGGVTPGASGGLYGSTTNGYGSPTGAGVNIGGAFTPAGAFSLSSTPLSGEAGDVVDMENFPGRSLGLQVLRQSVTANTRRLQAKWSTEAMQDLSAQHGYDLEAEITQALSAEIVHEIDNEIVTDLIRLAGTTELFDMAGSFTGTPHYVGDRHAVLGVLINKVANEIAAKTRRGSGNFIVVSPQIASVLQSASKSVFAPAVSGSFEGPNNTRLIGTLNGMIKVYSFLFDASFGAVAAASAVPGGATSSSQLVLVGYKGGDGEMDSGYFYCPYIPLMTSDRVIDPQTYGNQLAVMTRYGKCVFTSNTTSLGNSADYYGKIVVNNLAFV